MRIFTTSCLVAAALAMRIVAPRAALAGGSAPALSLTTADVARSSAGARSLVTGGSFNFDDLVQLSLPYGLVVFQGTHFVRYGFGSAVAEGDAPFLSDGLDATEVPALLATGSPATAPAALVRLRRDEVQVALPGTVTVGSATVQLYVVYETEPMLSNALTVPVP